jgi:hypothetical protein
MLKDILQMFRGKKSPDSVEAKSLPGEPIILEQEANESLYDFREVSVDGMKNRPDAIHDMFSGKSDGFLIKNFMTPEDADKLLLKLKEVQQANEQLAQTAVGFTYPKVFAEYSRKIASLPENEREAAATGYYVQMEKFNNEFDTKYGVNAYRNITSFFASIGGGRTVEQPEGINDVGRFPFVTFRYLLPKEGFMSIHCANYFGTIFMEAYAHLNAKVRAKNQMSYFVMLQEAEEGGELSLFNFRWQPGQTKREPNEDNEIIQSDGSKVYVQTDPGIRKNKIRPRKGDMVLFQGGNIWHRVEHVKGKTPRITFGGFLSLSHDDKKVYYWS